MKKAFFLILLSIFNLCIFGYTLPVEGYYFAPLYSSGIDLKSTDYPPRDSFLGTENVKGLTWRSENDFPSGNSDPGIYLDKNIVFVGGFSYDHSEGIGDLMGRRDREMRDALTGATLEMWVDTNTGSLEFVSLSDGAYKMPFKLYIILKTGSDAISTTSGDKTIQLLKIEDKMQPIQSEPLSFARTTTRNGSCVFFDVILAFPKGRFIDNSTVFIEEETSKTYFLAQRDDYSAMVTIYMQFKDKSGAPLGDVQSFTVPFSGYISNIASPSISKASITISMLPESQNLNLQHDTEREIPIANVNILANYGRQNKNPTLPNDILIFLSSNPSPYAKGEKFLFQNMTNRTGIATVANSLGFKLLMRTTAGELKFFEGDDFYEIGSLNSMANAISLNNDLNKKSESILHTGQSGSDKVVYYQYDGDVSILIDKAPESLNAGLYQEDAYLHVISVY